ncbi:MAG: sugar ABC transporter permease [Chloroflexota bacterium]
MITAQANKKTQSWYDKAFASKLMTPNIIVIIVICVFPLIYGIFLSFFQYELALPSPIKFVGFGNYLKVFGDATFWSAVKVSFISVIGGAALQLFLGFGAALILNRDFRGRSIIVAILLIPTTLAPVVVGFIFRMLLDDRFGPVNYLIKSIGLQPISWWGNPQASLPGIIIANGWEWFPFVMLVLLAGLQSVPQDLIDSARVDGASDWNVFWKIVLPLLKTVMVVVVLIRAIEDLKMFDIILVTTGGGPGIATQTMNMYAYQKGFSFFSIGYASALSYVQLILALILVRFLFSQLSKED